VNKRLVVLPKPSVGKSFALIKTLHLQHPAILATMKEAALHMIGLHPRRRFVGLFAAAMIKFTPSRTDTIRPRWGQFRIDAARDERRDE